MRSTLLQRRSLFPTAIVSSITMNPLNYVNPSEAKSPPKKFFFSFLFNFCLSGPDCGPDHREGFILRPRSELWQGLLLHLPGRHHQTVDVPLLHGSQRLGKSLLHGHVDLITQSLPAVLWSVDKPSLTKAEKKSATFFGGGEFGIKSMHSQIEWLIKLTEQFFF